MASYDDVYGLTYMAAKQAMGIRAQAISERESARVGFSSIEELSTWAKEY